MLLMSDNINLEDYEPNDNIIIMYMDDTKEILVSSGYKMHRLYCPSDTYFLNQSLLDKNFHRVINSEDEVYFYNIILDLITMNKLDKEV